MNTEYLLLYKRVNQQMVRGTFNANTATQVELLMADYLKHKDNYVKSQNYLKQLIIQELNK